MAKLSEIESNFSKILLYGEPGCGKTALALTLGDKALYCDFDKGLNTGRTIQDKFSSIRGEAEIETFYDEDPAMVTSFSRFKQFLVKLCNDCHAGKVEQKVLVIDSLTSMIEAVLNNIMSNSGKLGQNPAIQEYGMVQTEVTNAFRILKALKMHVITLAHVFVYTEGGLNQPEVTKRKIYIQGNKLEPKLTYQFDEIWYMESRSGKRQIKTLNTGRLLARSRSIREETISTEDVSMLEIFEKLNAKL